MTPREPAAPGAADGTEIARQIHDDVMQSLGVAMMHLEICRRLWDLGDLEAARRDLDGALGGLESAAASLRAIMNRLRPPLHDPGPS